MVNKEQYYQSVLDKLLIEMKEQGLKVVDGRVERIKDRIFVAELISLFNNNGSFEIQKNLLKIPGSITDKITNSNTAEEMYNIFFNLIDYTYSEYINKEFRKKLSHLNIAVKKNKEGEQIEFFYTGIDNNDLHLTLFETTLDEIQRYKPISIIKEMFM